MEKYISRALSVESKVPGLPPRGVVYVVRVISLDLVDLLWRGQRFRSIC